MKRYQKTFHTISCALFGFLWLCASATAGPVGNFHNSALWGKGVKTEKQYMTPVVSLVFDHQANDLRKQVNRYPTDSPWDSLEEIRHYDQTRWCTMEFDYYGIQVDFPINRQVEVYALFGITDNAIDFHYSDTAITKYSGTGYNIAHNFKSKGDMAWGCGLKAIFYQGEFLGIRNCRLGGDFFYRRLNAKDDIRITDYRFSYTTTLNECQAAFGVSTDLYDFTPYAAFRFSSITGHETYMNSDVDIFYDDDIEPQRVFGWAIGCGYDISWLAHVNLETRIGDETAVGLQFSVKY